MDAGERTKERDSLSALKVSVRETFSLRYLAPFVCTHQFPISIFTTYSHVVKLGKECKVNVTFALCAGRVPASLHHASFTVVSSPNLKLEDSMQARVKQTQGEESTEGK